MDDIIKAFGERVRTLRKNRRLSQEALAEKANLHYTYIGGIERGERNPSLKNIGKIANALDINIKDFFQDSALPKAVIEGAACHRLRKLVKEGVGDLDKIKKKLLKALNEP